MGFSSNNDAVTKEREAWTWLYNINPGSYYPPLNVFNKFNHPLNTAAHSCRASDSSTVSMGQSIPA
jgi:hypothetical protein